MKPQPNRMNKKPRPVVTEDNDTEFVFGRHAAKSAIQNRGQAGINKVFIQEGSRPDTLNELIDLAKKANLLLQYVPKNKLDTLTDHQAHQGVVVALTPYNYASIDDLFDQAKKTGEDPFFVILDGIEDPHNLGSILRTADAAGVHGIIIPKHRAVGLTGVVAKTSTGAIEYVPVAKVTNLVATVKQLKDRGVWIFGTDMVGEDYREWSAKGPVALVIGNEGKGISPLLKKEMDGLITIPMVGHVQSLNASVAAAILMFQGLASRHPLAKP